MEVPYKEQDKEPPTLAIPYLPDLALCDLWLFKKVLTANQKKTTVTVS